VHATLVSTDILAAHLADPRWVVFDCRHDLARPAWGSAAYLESHIPGARFMHMDEDLAGPLTGRNGRHPLPDAAVFAAKLGAAGVGPATQVVAYDAQGGVNAARLWWMLRWLGHDAAAVLDGGLGKWLREARPQTAELPRIAPAAFTPHARALAVDVDFVASRLHDSGMRLVDARSAERYRGEAEPIDPVAGHIPGARNLPYADLVNADGSLRTPEELRKAMADAGVPDDGRIGAYCGSGVTAAHEVLALQLAGVRAALYVGSWSGWIADPHRPVATGPRPGNPPG